MDFTKKDSLALKGIAILMMYVHHFYLSPERWAGYTVDFFPLTESMTVYLAEFLKTCVCVFVFITGYGMTQSLKQKHPDFRPSSTDMLSYTRHRLVSLLSNFIFVYLLVILVSFPTGRFFEIYGRSGSSILYVLVDMFGLAKLFKTPSYVGTWWYMSLAIVLVVLFPLFVKLYREYRWAFLFAVMLLPRFLNLRVVNTNLLHYTLAMALGMYCAESDLFTAAGRPLRRQDFAKYRRSFSSSSTFCCSPPSSYSDRATPDRDCWKCLTASSPSILPTSAVIICSGCRDCVRYLCSWANTP